MDRDQLAYRRGPMRYRPSSQSSSVPPYEPRRRAVDGKVTGAKDCRSLAGKTAPKRSTVLSKDRCVPPKPRTKRRISGDTNISLEQMNAARVGTVASKRIGLSHVEGSEAKTPVHTPIELQPAERIQSPPRTRIPMSPSQSQLHSRRGAPSSPTHAPSNLSDVETTYTAHNVRSSFQRSRSRMAVPFKHGAELGADAMNASDISPSTPLSLPRKHALVGEHPLHGDASVTTDAIENKAPNSTKEDKPRKKKRGLMHTKDEKAVLNFAVAYAMSAATPSRRAFVPLPRALDSAYAVSSDKKVAVNSVSRLTPRSSPPRVVDAQAPSSADAAVSPPMIQVMSQDVAGISSVKVETTSGGDRQSCRLLPLKRPADTADEAPPNVPDRGTSISRRSATALNAKCRKVAAPAANYTTPVSKMPNKKHISTAVHGKHPNIATEVPPASIPRIFDRTLRGSLPMHPLVMPSREEREALRTANIAKMDMSRKLISSCIRSFPDNLSNSYPPASLFTW
ncbi:hypothetical protein H310_05780 [Aphanomyces invadans]|uniref:Uncharacterized protein n=1 Tax=Aphanomyces invadans TaxID=157072 RepID=A0A024U7L3_9STRA|nr:hypothetical protein H310_05780 [Aphanomyces invadans]ETW02215.1 hypothetical protein H310_05780 [Aphanomyces invadans]|eukprot:XP_008868820.1 hypothetical protein H310_05780 [Aphanomyces invadans]